MAEKLSSASSLSGALPPSPMVTSGSGRSIKPVPMTNTSTNNVILIQNIFDRSGATVAGIKLEEEKKKIKPEDSLTTILAAIRNSWGSNVYVDNPMNRRVGRAGKPMGTHVVHSDGTETILPISKPYPYIILQCELNLNSSKFGVFQQVPIISSGGFGQVTTGLYCKKEIAFKKFFLQKFSVKKGNRFLKETEQYSSLDYPHVVKIIGAVIEVGHIGIVMEKVNCTNFYEHLFIKGNKFTQNQSNVIVTQMAAGIQYLHTAKPPIPHCNIKSSNMLLCTDGQKCHVKVSDYGFQALKNATITMQSIESSFAVKETLRYAAPEVLRGDLLSETQLLQADIFSMTLVVYELITGEEAFEDLSFLQLQVNVGKGSLRPTLNNDVLTLLVIDLLRRGWDGIPQSRPTATQFVTQWSNTITKQCYLAP